MGNIRTWKDKTVEDIAQITDNSTVNDTSFWEGESTGFGVIKNIIDSGNSYVPVDRDFSDIATALADSDVQAYGAIRITKIHTLTSGRTVPVSDFAFLGNGRNTGFHIMVNAPGITITGLHGLFVNNMRFYGELSGANEDGIKIDGSTDCIINGCWFDNLGGYAIREANSADYNLYYGMIMRDTITGSPPIYILGSNYGHFVGTAT